MAGTGNMIGSALTPDMIAGLGGIPKTGIGNVASSVGQAVSPSAPRFLPSAPITPGAPAAGASQLMPLFAHF